MANYSVCPGVSVEVAQKREGSTMYLDIVVHTPWGNLTGRLAADSETLRQMLLSLRKQYAPALYDFALERSNFATVASNSSVAGPDKAVCTGAPSGRSMSGAMMVTQRMVSSAPSHIPFYRR